MARINFRGMGEHERRVQQEKLYRLDRDEMEDSKSDIVKTIRVSHPNHQETESAERTRQGAALLKHVQRGANVPRGYAAVRTGRKPPRRLARLQRGPLTWALGMVMLCILIPVLLVQRQEHVTPDKPAVRQQKPAPSPPVQVATAPQEPSVRVYLADEKRVEELPLEQYIFGVVAAEMPSDFELEALKAQAMVARTYIVRRLVRHDTSGVPVENADVTDTITHQAYLSRNELQRTMTADKLARISEAVQATRGIVLTYRQEPIEALFFSTSNGYTENSEEYWSQRIPYLRSVASPWDQVAPHFTDTVTMTLTTFLTRLAGDMPNIPASASAAEKSKALTQAATPRILSRTKGHRIGLIRMDGQNYTGREVREKLGLRSSEFTWSIRNNEITIKTTGNGHGVGMSQWGANGMAQQGASAEKIVKYYYTGIAISQLKDILPQAK